MEYTVSKGAPGKRQVSFSCPACQDRLKTPLESAGQEVECPTCGHLLLIPGVAELTAQQAEQTATEQAAERLRQPNPTVPSNAPANITVTMPVALRTALPVGSVLYNSPESPLPQYRGLLTAKSVFWVLAMVCYLVAGVGFVAGMCLVIYDASQPQHLGHGDYKMTVLIPNLCLVIGAAIGTAFYGFVLHVVGELIAALRDIAMNSFKR